MSESPSSPLSPSSSTSSAPRNSALLHRDLQLAITYVPVASLLGYERNARTHTPKQIELITSSIRSFGFVSPLVVDAEGVLIAGHGRLEAARTLGYEQAPVVRLDHLDGPQKRALRLADNQLAALAGWDEAMLALEFSDLVALDLSLDLSFDLAVTGFEAPVIDRFVMQAAGEAGDTLDVAPAPLREQPAVTQPDDLWRLGEHRLFCGDALEPAALAALMDGEQADMGLHDPPFNVKINGHVSSSGRHREFAMASGEMTAAQFTVFLSNALASTTAVLRPGALTYACMDWRHMEEILAAGRATSLELINLCVWNKGCGGMGSLYRSQHELVFVFRLPGAAHDNQVQLGRHGRNRTNVWDYPGGAAALREELKLHATPKPVAMLADAIRDCTRRGDRVLDAFAGSGSTILAAARTGRRARAMEIDPHYADVAIRRWQSLSGEQAVHVATGLTFADRAAQLADRSPHLAETEPHSVDSERHMAGSKPGVRQRRRAA